MRQNSNPADKKTDERFQRAAAQILAHADRLACDGTLVASWVSYRGRKLGPYWRVAFRDGGRHKSIYLGRSEPLAQRVRQLLEDLKQPQRQRKQWERLETQGRAALRRHKKLWERQLRAHGLHTRGYAVRGMRRLFRAATSLRSTLRRLSRRSAELLGRPEATT